MRNWHDFIIRLDKAKQAISETLGGDKIDGESDRIIGVLEGPIEYEINLPNDGYNYLAASLSLAVLPNNDKKTIYRRATTTFYSEKITSAVAKSYHATSVAGLVGGNRLSTIDNIQGISPNIRILNFQSNKNGFIILPLIQKYLNKNKTAPFIITNFSNYNSNDSILSITFPQQQEEINDFYQLKTDVINVSMRWGGKNMKNPDKKDLDFGGHDFLFRELMAYGRDGRGVLCIVSAGNEKGTVTDWQYISKSYLPLIVGASTLDLENDYTKLTVTYLQDRDTIPEIKPSYSNRGSRLDLCTPSNSDFIDDEIPKNLGVYSTTTINCGDIGDSDQILSRNIVSTPSYSEIVLNSVKGVMEGQSVEIGSPDKFVHEIFYIKNVNRNTNTIKLDRERYFTRTTYGTSVKITALKIKVLEKTGNNKVVVEGRNGLGHFSQQQKVFIYPNNDENLGIVTKITKVTPVYGTNNYIIELQNVFSFSDNLRLIPGQLSVQIKCSGRSDENYDPSIGSNLFQIISGNTEGFFANQLVLISNSSGSFKHVTNIDQVSNSKVSFKFFRAALDAEYTMETLAYGNYTSRFGGTSAAAPITTGLAGLILSINENLNTLELKHILKVLLIKLEVDTVLLEQTTIIMAILQIIILEQGE